MLPGHHTTQKTASEPMILGGHKNTTPVDWAFCFCMPGPRSVAVDPRPLLAPAVNPTFSTWSRRIWWR